MQQQRIAVVRSPKMIHFRKKAFTLLEVMVCLVIICILFALIFPGFAPVLRQVERISCTFKLKNLHSSFLGNLNDGVSWPQVPRGVSIGTVAEQQWWLDYSATNLGLSAKDWRCPSIYRMQHSGTNTQNVDLINYLPTLFDDKPATPTKWPRMPWFTESAGVHGNVNLSVRADGSVCPAEDH
jgi:prepilin-type N-terminal cleavage/methylation domain-containing protein